MGVVLLYPLRSIIITCVMMYNMIIEYSIDKMWTEIREHLKSMSSYGG